MDHVYTMNQLIEKTTQHNKPFCLPTVEYEKPLTLENELPEHGINNHITSLLQSFNEIVQQ